MKYDTLVIGSGIAGLFTALKLAEHSRVALATKSSLEESSTRYAQGGIAAVMFEDDDVELHIADTLGAGAGLCNEEAVRVLCTEGPAMIRDLIAIGVQFDEENGTLARGMEAAHSRHRVLHAGGDMTGARVEAALAKAVRANQNIEVFTHMFLTEILTEGGTAVGARFINGEIRASKTVLASGGAGQVFLHTTNPNVATGDGVAAAYRAGAVVAGAEFFQFHPTAMALPGTFLVSEAVRGEGAVLRNAQGERFVDELAPRDVVARAIAEEMGRQQGQPVMLDATQFSAEFLSKRFPAIDAACHAQGINWSKQLVPVTPAAHYWMGGIKTDLRGRTSIPGLFACGEVANTGVHGANRLASNSLLEGLVFGARVAQADHGAIDVSNAKRLHGGHMTHGKTPTKQEIGAVMWDGAGLVRDAQGLKITTKQLNDWAVSSPRTQEEWELRNLLTVGNLIVAGALARRESRGAHYRSDYCTTYPEQATSIEWKIDAD